MMKIAVATAAVLTILAGGSSAAYKFTLEKLVADEFRTQRKSLFPMELSHGRIEGSWTFGPVKIYDLALKDRDRNEILGVKEIQHTPGIASPARTVALGLEMVEDGVTSIVDEVTATGFQVIGAPPKGDAADFLPLFKADTVVSENVRFSSSTSEGTIRAVTLSGVDGEHVRSATAAGITYDNWDQKITIDWLEFHDITVPQAPALAAVAAEDIFGASSWKVEGMTLLQEGQRLAADAISMTDIRRSGGLISAADVSVQGLLLPTDLANADASTRDTLRQLNIHNVVLDAALKWRADPNKGLFALHDATLNIRGMGTVSASISFSDIDPQELRAWLIDVSEAPMPDSGRLLAASLRYEDQGLADIIIEKISDGDRDRMSMMVASLIRLDPQGISPATDNARQAARAFILNTGGFSISLEPPQPVDPLMLKVAERQGTLAQALGLRISGW